MKILRVICLLALSLLAIFPLGTALAQQSPAYSLNLTPYGGRYDTTMIAGGDKIVSLTLENTGTAAVNNINFSAEKPDDWEVRFSPTKLAALDIGSSRSIDATIKVPSGAEAGDFMVTIKASGDQASAKEVAIRVTVIIPIREAKIELRPLYPRLEGIAGEEFVFEVEFLYTAAKITGEPVTFELATKTPPAWEIAITPPYEKEKKLTAISLKPGFTFGDKQRVAVKAPIWPLPDPGEYKISLEAVEAGGGKLKASVEFTAVIKAKYTLAMVPAGQRYNTRAKTGRDNFFSVMLGNLGSAPIDNIKFSSTKPEGWTIEFKPDKVDSLDAIDSQTIEVNIKPPPETIAGDYVVKLSASGTQTTSPEMEIRVTVETPTVWGWVGVGVILLVIVGLVGIFMRFSRR